MSSLTNPQAVNDSQEKLSPCSTMIHPDQNKTEITHQHRGKKRKAVKKVEFSDEVIIHKYHASNDSDTKDRDDASNAPDTKDEVDYVLYNSPEELNSLDEVDSLDEVGSTYNQKDKVELIENSDPSSFASSNPDHQGRETLPRKLEGEEPSESVQDLNSGPNNHIHPQISSSRSNKRRRKAL
ncbi:hypothetical protein H4219_005035 [Mycoemilia scoparia]|uniref:Uncharacterized protein n=1 Tax=Mycoemilia scoparia TaxID=417184 RepID=A0A9W7ZXQ1_9FUNG|nr:hypothetical protein H4219_005035 [Mycoemilia scoparia]